MKNAFAAAILATAITTAPAVAGNLSDPVVEPAVVAEAAEKDSGKVDALLITIWAALAAATVGGAF